MSPDEEEQTEAAPEAPIAEAPAAEEPVAQTDESTTESDGDAPAAEASESSSAESRERSDDRDGRDSSEGEDDRGGRRKFFGRRKVCTFCVEKATSIDYKDPGKLRRYVSDRGRIEARRRTGTCAKHQRWLATALKRARHIALLPYAPEHIRISGAFAPRR